MSLKNVILGFLEEPASGYDIKKSIDDSLSHLWAAEASQVYAKLRSMEKDGLLTSTKEKSDKGPDRRVYHRTPKGDDELADWLNSEPELSHERLSSLAQIHFLSRSRNPTQTSALIENLRERFVERLDQYEARNTQDGKPEAGPVDALFDKLALDLSVKTLKARIEWCDEVIQRLTPLSEQGNENA